eukprot:3934394-Rhodomonas_salina.1
MSVRQRSEGDGGREKGASTRRAGRGAEVSMRGVRIGGEESTDRARERLRESAMSLESVGMASFPGRRTTHVRAGHIAEQSR